MIKPYIYIDEAGRGCLAGPVYTGLVLVLKDFNKKEFTDSKLLSEKKRENLYKKIVELENTGHIIFSSGIASSFEIDKYGISLSLNIAIKRGIKILQKKHNFTPERLIIDGNYDFGLTKSTNLKVQTIKKGDLKVPFISMASIVAKVERDLLMKNISNCKKFKKYNLSKHKGYGTKEHRDSIKNFGYSKLHRISFLKNLLKEENLF